MASSITLSPASLSSSPQTEPHSINPPRNTITLRFQLLRTPPRLHASRRISNFTQGGSSLVDDHRNWNRNRSGMVVGDYSDDDDDDDDDDEDDEDRSLDLLVRFVQNMFKKISRRARKAVRSVLPLSISTKLVGFSVNGVIMLAFLWVLKAFLEVVCTLGSVVFVSILLIRGIWSGVTYFQENRNHKVNELDDEHRAWTGALPAT